MLAHYAGGKLAPPKWVVHAMRALEASYERKLAAAREAQLRAEEIARSAAASVVAVDAAARDEETFALSSVQRASEATEMAGRIRFEAQHENEALRAAVAAAQHAAGEAEARCVHAQHETRQMAARLEDAEVRAADALNAADAERQRAAALEASLEASRDEGNSTRIALERSASECTRATAEVSRLREHARELAQGIARPRSGGGPQPLAMGSPAEWAALREERDALVQLLIQLRKAGEGAHRAGARTVRVGGGYEKLPEYLAKLTSALPPELKQAQPPPPFDDAEKDEADGVRAPTHGTQARYVANPAHASAYVRRHGVQGTHGPLPWRGAGTPRAHALFAPSRPVNVLVHQTGHPPTPPHEQGVAQGSLEPSGAYTCAKDYPAVGMPELFGPIRSASSPRLRPL